MQEKTGKKQMMTKQGKKDWPKSEKSIVIV